jgi:pimeloyl-ACP methyl ester carboxylesterase
VDVLLISGLWLPSSIWMEVIEALTTLGHRARAARLPGVDDTSATATLEDQVQAVLAAIDETDEPFVVGHSAACTLAWIAADRRPEAIAGVAFVGGFPASDGEPYADFFPLSDGVMPFPGWEPFEGPDVRDLDEATRDRIAALTVPVPGGVATGVVRLGDDRRFDVPAVMVCPEYDVEQAKAWVGGGDVPELAMATRLSYLDIDSGHWPMFSCPIELARAIDSSAAMT